MLRGGLDSLVRGMTSRDAWIVHGAVLALPACLLAVSWIFVWPNLGGGHGVGAFPALVIESVSVLFVFYAASSSLALLLWSPPTVARLILVHGLSAPASCLLGAIVGWYVWRDISPRAPSKSELASIEVARGIRLEAPWSIVANDGYESVRVVVVPPRDGELGVAVWGCDAGGRGACGRRSVDSRPRSVRAGERVPLSVALVPLTEAPPEAWRIFVDLAYAEGRKAGVRYDTEATAEGLDGAVLIRPLPMPGPPR